MLIDGLDERINCLDNYLASRSYIHLTFLSLSEKLGIW